VPNATERKALIAASQVSAMAAELSPINATASVAVLVLPENSAAVLVLE
jgi:hypothetical protein